MHSSAVTVPKLSAALIDALAELENPGKSKTAKVPTKSGGQFSYGYAPLDAILNALRPILKKHGLVAPQEVVSDPQNQTRVGVITRLIHVSGEWLEFGPLYLPAAGGAQDSGSASTYARRYALCAALGIAAEEDDDGASSPPAKVGPDTAKKAGDPPSSSAAGGANVQGQGGAAVTGKDGQTPSPADTSEVPARGAPRDAARLDTEKGTEAELALGRASDSTVEGATTRSGAHDTPPDNAGSTASASTSHPPHKFKGDDPNGFCLECGFAMEAEQHTKGAK